MRKPIPYKKNEPVKKTKIGINLNKKKIVLFILCEIIIIILSIVSTAVISLLFKINPSISAIISGVMLITLSIFVSSKFLRQ